MRTIQERKLSMYLAVKDFLGQSGNAAIIGALPNFNTYLTSFNSNVVALQSTREVQELDRTGVAVQKRQLAFTLTTKAMDVAAKVRAFAVNSGDTVLEGEVSYTRTQLEKSADTILRDRCEVIHTKANENLAALAAYGITAAVLTDLQNAIDSFAVAIPKPRLGITTRKQATEAMQVLFDNMDTLLNNKMDVLVEMLKTTQAVFYKRYGSIRLIVNAGSSLISARGIVKDVNGNAAISNVTVRIQVQGSDVVPSEAHMTKADAKKALDVFVRSSNNGYFQAKRLPEGNYIFTFSKSGYKTVSKVVAVTNGERTELDVKMEIEG